ncbi:hypothetical protein BAC7755_22560 [Bacillus sp. MN7755]|uniref:Uncharacterized protein n=1 Tax=Bacillus cereus TaxID=1396 RepID=A0A164BRF1_BACCE|nr:hypothetical protein B4082_5480 [Bacillus cereus]
MYNPNPLRGNHKENSNAFFGLEKERYVSVILLPIDIVADEGYASYLLPVDRIAKWK